MHKPTTQQNVIATLVGFCLITLVIVTIRDWPILMAMDTVSGSAYLCLIGIMIVLDVFLLVVHFLKMTRGK